jgi:hypothetical protein
MKLLNTLAVAYLASTTLAQEHVSSQASSQVSCDLNAALDPSSPCTLEDLADDVLEQCCLDRGFELARQDGVTFSHAEYVEAAKQCLELEAELNKLLEENPDLLAELEAEQAAAAAATGEGGGEGIVEDVSAGAGVAAATIEEVEEVVEVEEAAEVKASVLPEVVKEEAVATPAADETPDVLDLDVEVETDIEVEAAKVEAAKVEAETETETEIETPPLTQASSSPSLGNSDKANLLNPAGLSMAELWSGFKEKVSSDVNMVCDKVIPAPLRGPVKGAVKKAMKVTKSLVNTGFKTAKRTVMTFIDEKRAQMGAEKVEVEVGRVGL